MASEIPCPLDDPPASKLQTAEADTPQLIRFNSPPSWLYAIQICNNGTARIADLEDTSLTKRNSNYIFEIFARNFRGFRQIDAELGDITFIVGDNSSGKTSIVNLVNLLLDRTFGMEFNILTANDKFKTSHDILSPYIKSPVVTVGLMISKKIPAKNEFETTMRLATYEKSKNDGLLLTKAVSGSGNKARYILSRPDGVVLKDRTLSSARPSFDKLLSEHDHPSGGYKKLRIPGWKKLPNFIMFGLTDYNAAEKSVNLRFTTNDLGIQHRVFGPIRMDPEHAYNVLYSNFDEKGRHTPSVLKTLFSERKAGRTSALPHIREINKFGRESGMFDRLFVSSYKIRDPKAPFKIEVEKKGKRFSLDEVGYGVSQILPVIVDAITRSTSGLTLLSIQQPELHLHPRAQAAFGELLFDLAKKKNLKFLIETHSDYIINRYRYCLHTYKSDLETKIFFCENTRRGNVVHLIDVNGVGNIIHAPPSYRRFFLDEERNMFRII